jgi:hypothetical protein
MHYGPYRYEVARGHMPLMMSALLLIRHRDSIQQSQELTILHAQGPLQLQNAAPVRLESMGLGQVS